MYMNWIGFRSLKIELDCQLLENCNEFMGSIKDKEFFLNPEGQSVFEWFHCMELYFVKS
jgi:hypothetical protein